MIRQQQTLVLSPYAALYDIVVAIDPIRMFKYLLLKAIFELSDVDIVERSKYDLSFKFFLGMAPEDSVIDPSSLTKFRKLRLKDMNLLDMLIGQTVALAIEQGILKSTSIIVDATHTKARYNQKSPQEILQDRARKLRKVVYSMDESVKAKMPAKNMNNVLEDEIAYCQKLVAFIEEESRIAQVPKIVEPLNLLKETIEDDVEQLRLATDPDARVGHKSADSAFFGYKTHLAMTEERLITAAVITTGEKNDGKQLQTLIEKSQTAGMQVKTVIGDTAYSEKDNLIYTKQNEIELVAKLNPLITQGARKKEDEFLFNKDAGMYVCPAGHMAIRKARQGKKGVNKNQQDTYFFDVEICKRCPFKEGCYKEGAKSKTYSVTVKSDEHSEQMAFQDTEYFKAKSKERYKIEAKNSELKHGHGYDVATSSGLLGMQLQGAMAIFAVNLKRILKLVD
ncbi:Transposase DDE domain-containing protein [Paenibacillus uliginis N3/975]|uniref:Transposase DDE domain-containing protein n=1 Tax=Paenibacillus uliginis N3/975 TaxID=1313296 RepID=A0A1X7HHN6_9BACL|nr:IS1182 family transposase [Paenibacillus uliginis]SMF86166.1 Transposase DDE domain-containing protein [Paenibacillus uliginis N3/975]